MMGRNHYLTLTVRDLPLGTTAQDVRDHINRRFTNAQPLVGPLVKDPNRPSLYTVVTVRQDSDSQCRELRDSLNLSKFFPQKPKTAVVDSQIAVSDEFLGVTTLAEDEDPQFDLYFIHGLGGHAFGSWTLNKSPPRMWPRDFLAKDIPNRPRRPNDPEGPKLAARISTIGYNAHAQRTHSSTTTIERAAEDLLEKVRTDRPEDCDRPMYFACHSLGGLVTCQALIHALRGDPSIPEEQSHYRKVFFQKGQCLVKGIIFFGTPFEGSKIANFAHKFVKVLGGNDTLIDSLRTKSDVLAELVGKFNQLRSHPETGFPIIIGYEKSPMFNIKFVTKPDSATGSFNARTIGIDGDHRTMVKFEHRHCTNYHRVSEAMIRLIQDTLPALDPITFGNVNGPDLPLFRPEPLRKSHTLPPPYPGLSGTLLQAAEPVLPAYKDETSGLSVNITQRMVVRSSIMTKEMTENAWPNEPCWNEVPDVSPVKFDDLVRPIHDGEKHKSSFSLLGQFDTVFLLDDTGSMVVTDSDGGRSRWEELIDSLRHTVDIVCQYDKDGVEVRFFIQDHKDEDGITDGQRVLDLLTKEVGPDEQGGGTYVSNALWAILVPYIDRFEEWKNSLRDRSKPKVKMPKMLNLIVITDGAADDKEGVESVIVSAAKRLDQLSALPSQVGIQFLQIGKDDDAARWLKTLDDSLREKHGVRDIVDTRPWDSPKVIDKPFKDRLSQILLGAVSRARDDSDTAKLEG
ncbi:hypothetical protein MFIFM68171_01649 [Madurella fahalii]|uniref:VWFA domain-containing protein n=1 Tax=Madurella fahalii TaxID=1157608 RepID=A0ABQ0G128_9PEZI